MKLSHLSLSLSLLPSLALAQMITPPSSQASAPASQTVSVSPSGGSMDSGTFERTMDKIFDFNSDSINLEDGTLNWKGKTFEIGNSKVVKARFERYLAMDLRDQNFENYQKILREITSMLYSNNDDLSDETIRAAWNKLYDAAEYDIDNDGCISIANNVFQTWRMRNEFNRYRISETEFKRNMESAKRLALRNLTFMEEQQSKELESGSINRHNMASKVAKNREGTARAKSEAAEIAKMASELAVKKATSEATGAKAVLQFQSQTLTFLLARKFQHATISAYFYRHLYKAGAQNFEVGKEQFTKFFPISNFMPTNDIVENLATEARNDVREGMISVNVLYDSKQRYSALQRLMETFVLGENEPSVRSFDFEKKKVLLQLYRDMSALKDLGDNHDLEGIEKTLERIKEVADDFPYREIYSKVKIGKQASNLKVMEARAAAFSGDMDAARAALAEAAQIWPLNPELDKFNDEVMQMTVGISKYEKRFDELLEKKNYREIMSEAGEYAIALKSDAKKSAKLKEVVADVSQIDFLIAQAKELDTQGNSYVAWEMLEKAKLIDENDPVLSRAMADMAPRVADYVRLLDSAKDAEKKGANAAALTLFLAAQDVFPMSQTCREGIARTANAVLGDIKE